MPAASCALVAPLTSDSLSHVGMDSMRSVAPMLVDVDIAGPSPWMGPRDGFLDLKTFFTMRFISLMKEKGLAIT